MGGIIGFIITYTIFTAIVYLVLRFIGNLEMNLLTFSLITANITITGAILKECLQ